MAKGKFNMGGMGGGMGNMLKQAQAMQENLMKVQAEFEEKTFDVTAGGGAVALTINGKNELISIKLQEDVVDPEDIEMLEDLIVSAVNEGIKTVEKEKAERMGKVAGGLPGIPGLF